MADPTFVTQYRIEQLQAFAQRYSILRDCCTREQVLKGNSAVFQVSDPGTVQAVTRSVNGLIPYGRTDNTQNTCTLVETHATANRTSFDIFATQGDMKRQMQIETVGKLNKDIDQSIIDQLDTATQDTGSAVEASLDLIMKSEVILGNANVPIEDEENMFCVITPAFRAFLMQATEFASGDYVEVKPFNGPVRRMWRWAGKNWLLHTGLTGIGTATEKCYMFHKTAMGHAANMADMSVTVGYNDEHDYSYSRATLYHNAKLLQNTGIVQMLHDGSRYVAS